MAGVLLTGLLLASIVSQNGGVWLVLVQPGRDGPASAVIAHDFPSYVAPAGVGHDGQQFYVIARQPMHPKQAAAGLDNPRYRLQRILFPVLSWALHPSGGGGGLVRAMLALNLLAVFLGGVALGALSATLGGPSWAAAAFAPLPGALATDRLTTADNLALTLILAAFALSLRSRHWWALAAAVAAVLTREVSVVALVGLAVWRRDRYSLALVGFPGAVGLGWFLVLRSMFPRVRGGGDRVGLLDGLRTAAVYWWRHDHSMLAVGLLTAVLVTAAVITRWHSPLRWAIVLESLMVLFLADNTLALFWNGSRTLLPPVALAVVALVTPPDRVQPDVVPRTPALARRAR